MTESQIEQMETSIAADAREREALRAKLQEDNDFNILPVGRFRGYNYTPSGWRCELFGADSSMVLRPCEGNVPNAFWRWMQYLCFGNKWIKEEKK